MDPPDNPVDVPSRLDPQVVWENYPAGDLLGIGPPASGETPAAYIRRAERRSGDTLFAFLVREMCSEPLSRTERLRRCDRAIEEIAALKTALERQG